MDIRRWGDIGLSLALLLVCLPVILLCCLAVSLEHSAAPLMRVERVTRDGQIVSIWRLRTMRDTTFGPRLTTVGAALRRLHLHEIPQLLNVLAGDFSFFGARSGFVQELGHKKAFALRQP